MQNTNCSEVWQDSSGKCYAYITFLNLIGGVMANMLASCAVDHGFDPWSGKTKEYRIVICCFSVKHIVIRNKSKVWMVQNWDTVPEWSFIPTRSWTVDSIS